MTQKAEPFANNYETLYNISCKNNQHDIDIMFQIQGATINREGDYSCLFKEEELSKVLGLLKNFCPGLDDVHNLFLKNIDGSYRTFLLSVFNNSWLEETVPVV